MEAASTPRSVLTRSAAVMAAAQLAVGVVCRLAARDVTPVATQDAFNRFAAFAFCAGIAMVLLALANLGGSLRTLLAAAAVVVLGIALVFWLLAVARDVGTTWLWLGAPLLLIDSWLAVGTWKSRTL
jgi:hypothetical protein